MEDKIVADLLTRVDKLEYEIEMLKQVIEILQEEIKDLNRCT